MTTPIIAASAAWLAVFLAPPLGACAEPAPFPAGVLASVVTVLPVRSDAARPARADAGLRGEERSGSGVVLRSGGYIATAAHVLDGAQSVSVRLYDGRELPAAITARDTATDLALLQVTEELPPLALGPEPALGAPVCGVGNPFGVGLSVSCGVVSALRRSGMGFNRIEDFVQTDAVLNPGTSGGALIDRKGRLVGLVSAIFTRRSDANIGVNFAVSTNLLIRVVDDLLKFGRVVPGRAGFQLSLLPAAERRRYAGLRVTGLTAGGAAERAGLRTGDLVTAIGGRALRKRSDVRTAIFLHRPGDRVPLVAMRDGQRRAFTMTLR
jgi:S1-C subfamily serine protease